MRYPMFCIAVYFSAGIMFGHFIEFSFAAACFFFFLFIAVSMVSKRRIPINAGIMAAFICLGAIYGHSYQQIKTDDVSRIAGYYRGKDIRLRGIVGRDLRKQKYFNLQKTVFTLSVKEAESPWGWKTHSGKVLVNIFKDEELNYGDRIEIRGKLHRPYNFSDSNFSYRDYLENHGIRYVLSVKKDNETRILDTEKAPWLLRCLTKWRHQSASVFDHYLTEGEAGIMKAVILGDRSGIPKHVRNLFVQTGTVHILAISGLHIGIIVGLIYTFLKICPLRKEWHYILTVICLAAYTLMTGMRPSVLRAVIMSSVFMFGFVLEKNAQTFNSLGLAAFLLLIFNPLNIFHLGFQLSFMCILFILALADRIRRWLDKLWKDKRSLSNFIKQSLGVSIAAWTGVCGLIVYYFNIVTPVTVIANLIIVPLLGVIVALGLGLLAAGAMCPSAAVLFAPCLKFSLNMTIGIIFLFEKFPFAHFTIQNITIWHTTGYYLILLVLYLFKFLLHQKYVRPGHKGLVN